MAVFNSSTRELVLKIVYYGPALCGKTTNLEYVYSQMPEDKKGKMLSLATESDRTLFFDFLPLDLGKIQGWNLRIQLYTVPGQVFYDATRRLVLKGADGIVFVADSQRELLEANVESLKNMKENLRANGLDYQTIPLVFQYNKRDLKDILPVEELNNALNERNVPYFEAIAIQGKGVMETLKEITRLTISAIQHRITGEKAVPAEPVQTERTEAETRELETVAETEEEQESFESLPESYDQIEELEPIEEIPEIMDLEAEFDDLADFGHDTDAGETAISPPDDSVAESLTENETDSLVKDAHSDKKNLIEATPPSPSSSRDREEALILDSDAAPKTSLADMTTEPAEIKIEKKSDGFLVTIVLKLNIKLE